MSATHTLLLGVALGIASGATIAIAQETSATTEADGSIAADAGNGAVSGDVVGDGAVSADDSGDAAVGVGDSGDGAVGDGVTMDGDADAGAAGEATDPVLIAPDVDAAANADVGASGDTMATEGSDMITAPDGSITVALETIAETDQLVGARVYDANNEWIGEVSAVMQGDADIGPSVVVDVGGFLGIGEKPVQVEEEAIGVVLTDGGAIDYIIVTKTQAQLEAMPEVEM